MNQYSREVDRIEKDHKEGKISDAEYDAAHNALTESLRTVPEDDAEYRYRTGVPVKSRAEDNKRLRQRRKDAGLVHYRVWVTESEKRALEDALRYMRILDKK